MEWDLGTNHVQFLLKSAPRLAPDEVPGDIVWVPKLAFDSVAQIESGLVARSISGRQALVAGYGTANRP